jgi:cellulose synthase/poly-beta-1,6-N-acetylglucosamine synthase-like glycosyltransferase
MAQGANSMTTAWQILFWVSAGLLLYVYAGYPILVFLAGVLWPKAVKKGKIEPPVTIVITAFNEEAVIREKLENTLKIDYPPDKLEILVASDGSTDRTDTIVGEFAGRGVKLFRQEGRAGKTVTQNNAVERATGEIILFSDATTTYGSYVLHVVLPAFADPDVGCVAGRLVYVDDENSNVGKGARRYWGYETFLKIAESNACSLIGASGCLYAVRRSAYEPMYPEACSDFLICTDIYRKGLRSVFEPDAVCFEQTNQLANDEMRMRVRVISQTFTDLWRNRDMLNPFKSGFYAVELISHKALRYAVPLILFALLLPSFMLTSSSFVYQIAVVLQVVFYAGAAGGWLVERMGKRLSLLAIPFYFVLANLASVIGFYKFIRGERYAAWEPIR